MYIWAELLACYAQTLGIAPVPCWVANNSFSFIMECSVPKLEIFNSDMHN